MSIVAEHRTPLLLVVGLGNRLAGDDAVGADVVTRLEAGEWPNCGFREVSDPLALLWDDLAGFDLILVIDAVQSGSPTGTVHFLPLSVADLESREISTLTTHGFGLTELLGIAEALKRRLPPMFLLGIECASDHGASEAVKRAADRVVAEFDKYYRPLLRKTS